MTTAFAVSQTYRSLSSLSILSILGLAGAPAVCRLPSYVPHSAVRSPRACACCLPRFASVKVNSKLLLAKLLWRLVATPPAPAQPANRPLLSTLYNSSRIYCLWCVHSAHSERSSVQGRLSVGLVGLINCNWCNFVANIFALSFSWISFFRFMFRPCLLLLLLLQHCSFSFAVPLHCCAFNFKPDCSYIKTFDCMGNGEREQIRAEYNVTEM